MTTGLTAEAAGIKAKINFWHPGEPVLASGKVIAWDTETHMIDLNNPRDIPDLVLLTAYAGGDYVDLIMWKDVPLYMQESTRQNPQSYYVFHNAPFDINVLGFDFFVTLVDSGRIWDTGLQYLLHSIKFNGFMDEKEYPKLSQLSKEILNYELEKDNEVRCTFNRSVQPSEAHLKYACKDSIVTWKIAVSLGYLETIDIQIKGFLTLNSISRNGMRVDMQQLKDLQTRFMNIMETEKAKLLTWGIKLDKEKSSTEKLEWINDVFGLNREWKSSQEVPTRELVLVTYVAIKAFDKETAKASLQEVVLTEQDKKTNKDTNAKFLGIKQHIVAELGIPVEDTDKGEPNLTKTRLVNILYQYLSSLYENNTRIQAIEDVREAYEDHDGWPSGQKEEGTNTVIQELMRQAECMLGVTLPKTKNEKNG